MIGLYGTKTGVRLSFVIAFILGGASLLLQQIMIVEEKRENKKTEGSPFKALKLINPALRNLLISDILIRFCEQIPYAFVVIWCVTRNGITLFWHGCSLQLPRKPTF